MMTRRRVSARPLAALLTAALVIAPALADDPPRPSKDLAPPAAVPFQMLPSNHMVVEANLNGKGPYRLIFDLGSPVILLSNKAGEESGAIPEDAPRSFLFATRGEGKVETLTVGDLTATDLPVIVLDHPALKALGGILGKPIDGIIGYTFFARYRTTIDYQAREMTFTPVEFEVRDLMKDLQSKILTRAPRVAPQRVVSPRGLWGLTLGDPVGGVSSPGVPITSVLAGSPASAAGLRPGDILTTLDGRWTTSLPDTFAAAAGVPPGRSAEVVILRDGAETTVTVTPREGI